MLNYNDIRFDCQLYNGYKPCAYKSQCKGCTHFVRIDGFPNADFSVAIDGRHTNDGIPAILIVKTGALGDVLRTTSLLPALAKHFPNIPVDWATAASSAPLLRDNPYIRNLYTLDSEEDMDTIVSRQCWSHVYCYEKDELPLTLVTRVATTHRFGFGPNIAGKPVAFNDEAKYAVMLGLDDDLKFRENTKPYSQVICEAAALPYARAPYVLTLNTQATELSHRLRTQWKGRPVIGFNTGCGPVFATKRWLPSHWIQTVHLLHEQFPQASIVLLGGQAEMTVNQIIADACPFVLDSGSENSLSDFCGVVNACDIVVTADSLAMHIAIALQKSIVAIFGSTSDTEIDLYERGEHVVAQADCRPCFKKTCPFSQDEFAECMRRLEPSTVVAAISRQIAGVNEDTTP